MISLILTEDARTLIQRVAELRYPAETVLLLGGDVCGNAQSQLVESTLVNSGVDVYLGQATEDVKVFTSGGTPQFAEVSALCFDTERIKPNFCSDSFFLEAQLGYRLLCRVQLQTKDLYTPIREKLNV